MAKKLKIEPQTSPALLEPWMGVNEIAKHLGVSKETIYRGLEAGLFPAHRIGKLWRFKASEVDEWMRREQK